jgi:hypothetical protein
LVEYRNALRLHGVTGRLLLDGSYVSARPEPGDFDVLLIAPPEIQALKALDPGVSRLLSHQYCQQECGFTVFYAPEDSRVIGTLCTMWDRAKDGVQKGSVEVTL